MDQDREPKLITMLFLALFVPIKDLCPVLISGGYHCMNLTPSQTIRKEARTTLLEKPLPCFRREPFGSAVLLRVPQLLHSDAMAFTREPVPPPGFTKVIGPQRSALDLYFLLARSACVGRGWCREFALLFARLNPLGLN